MEKTCYTINDLPRFSPWPARLLGLGRWEQRCKTPQEIHREYELEKWGPLLARIQGAKREVSLEEVDGWVLNDIPVSLRSIGRKLELLSAVETHHRYKDLVQDVLGSYLPASALVELGAGYGSVILSLAKRESFAGMRIIAGEYIASGLELIRRLAQTQGLEIEAGYCDLASPIVTDLAIPENALIFTSYAACYVPKLKADFVEALSAFRPLAVVLIEPCYEHCDSNTLLGLMRRRYIEVNDYNTNWVTLLHDQQQRGLITILEERPAVFGMNPLLAASIVAWAPQD